MNKITPQTLIDKPWDFVNRDECIFVLTPMDNIHFQHRGTVIQLHLAARAGMHNSTSKILTQDSLSQQSQVSGGWEGIWGAPSQPWKSFCWLLWGLHHICVVDLQTLKYPTHGSMVACLSVWRNWRNYIPHCSKSLLPSWNYLSLLKSNFILCCPVLPFHSSLMNIHPAAWMLLVGLGFFFPPYT